MSIRNLSARSLATIGIATTGMTVVAATLPSVVQSSTQYACGMAAAVFATSIAILVAIRGNGAFR